MHRVFYGWFVRENVPLHIQRHPRCIDNGVLPHATASPLHEAIIRYVFSQEADMFHLGTEGKGEHDKITIRTDHHMMIVVQVVRRQSAHPVHDLMLTLPRVIEWREDDGWSGSINLEALADAKVDVPRQLQHEHRPWSYVGCIESLRRRQIRKLGQSGPKEGRGRKRRWRSHSSHESSLSLLGLLCYRGCPIDSDEYRKPRVRQHIHVFLHGLPVEPKHLHSPLFRGERCIFLIARHGSRAVSVHDLGRIVDERVAIQVEMIRSDGFLGVSHAIGERLFRPWEQPGDAHRERICLV